MSQSTISGTDSYSEALALAESGGAGARPISRNGMRVGRTMAGAGWGQLAFWAHQEEAAQARAANEEAASRAGWVSAQGLSRDESGAVLVDRRLAFMSNDGNLVAQFDAGSGARLYTASDESGAMLLTIMESDGSTTTQAVPAGQWMQFDELVFRQWYEATYLVAASPVVAAVPAPAPTQAAAVEPAPVPTDALPRTQHAGITLAMVQSLPEPARIIITTAALDFIGERAVSRDW